MILFVLIVAWLSFTAIAFPSRLLVATSSRQLLTGIQRAHLEPDSIPDTDRDWIRNESTQVDEGDEMPPPPSSSLKTTATTTAVAATTTNDEARTKSRWSSLNPNVKARIVQAAQRRAVANKEKRESPQIKKRRMMMFMKEKENEKKLSSRVRRPLPLDARTPLGTYIPGMEVTGIVISLTDFGAYVDIGTECDGLLHISQMSHTSFIQHPRQVIQPGDEITVRIRSINPEKRKLHLTMLPPEVLKLEDDANSDSDDRIQLDNVQVDDELWGELRRVTDYGAYVDVGAVVHGFLHFMDHPAFGWSQGAHPSQFMNKGDRVRVWVSDVDMEKQRIKLTAIRPPYLPGPRREL